jgi:hypothetical protein
MERTDVLELMSTLKLYGMRAAYDEVMATGIKRRHEPSRIVGDLLSAEIAALFDRGYADRLDRGSHLTHRCRKADSNSWSRLRRPLPRRATRFRVVRIGGRRQLGSKN